MKLQYRILGRFRRQRVRMIARSAWIDTDCDAQRAQRLANYRINDQFHGVVTTLLISLAIKLAIALIQHWLRQSVGDPSETFVAGEPGSDTTHNITR